MKIKVRAWDGEQFVSPDYLDRDGVAHWKANSIPTSSKIVELWTGFLDKNGQEIYHKDLFKDSTGISIVEWSDRHASFCLRRDGWMFDHYFGEAVDPEDGEVIGNIHENPI